MLQMIAKKTKIVKQKYSALKLDTEQNGTDVKKQTTLLFIRIYLNKLFVY